MPRVNAIVTHIETGAKARVTEADERGNLKIETLDGSRAFSWVSYTGGEGYTLKHSSWTFCQPTDVIEQ